jgi:2,3-bisphosphoglycerate-dependent phosphoglycerate mutase
MATTKVYLVRHAHAAWAPDESRSLSESGRAAAVTIAGLLSAIPVAAIYSSPARRSIQTVELLAQRLGVRVDVVPELRERHLPVVPARDFERIVREAWRFPTHATGEGESNAVAQTRGLAAVHQFIKRHAGQHVVVGTHGNLLALILNGFDPWFGYEFWRELSFPDVYEVEFEATRLIRVRRLWEEAA